MVMLIAAIRDGAIYVVRKYVVIAINDVIIKMGLVHVHSILGTAISGIEVAIEGESSSRIWRRMMSVARDIEQIMSRMEMRSYWGKRHDDVRGSVLMVGMVVVWR